MAQDSYRPLRLLSTECIISVINEALLALQQQTVLHLLRFCTLVRTVICSERSGKSSPRNPSFCSHGGGWHDSSA